MKLDFLLDRTVFHPERTDSINMSLTIEYLRDNKYIFMGNLLCNSSERGDVELVRTILREVKDVSRIPDALSEAVHKNHPEVVRVFLTDSRISREM
jgi:hypothetical protein